MSDEHEFDQALQEALAGNGAFDPRKADALRRHVVTDFSRRLRKVERTAWVYVIGLSAVAVYAALRLLYGGDTKELILFGVLAVIALEKLTVIKLWYWVMNNKLSVLKELRQLRLQMPAAAEPEPLAGRAGGPEFRTHTLGCSGPERCLWWAVMLVILVIMGILAQWQRFFPLP
jgi:hypothetical protein